MKRWSRSIIFLLASPLLLLSMAVADMVPSLKVVMPFVGPLLFILVFYGQILSVALRDKKALGPLMSACFLGFGLIFSIMEYTTPMQFTTRQQVFAYHATLFTLIVVGGSTIYDTVRSVPPKHWWATFQLWQRGVATVG